MDATVSTLKKIDTKQGSGTEAFKVKTVIVHYTGWLYDPGQAEGKGKKFDSSLDRRDPFGFSLGQGQVIRGWDEGVAGMKIGGKRTLIIPADMGYGARGAGGVIPPNAALVFDVELHEVRLTQRSTMTAGCGATRLPGTGETASAGRTRHARKAHPDAAP